MKSKSKRRLKKKRKQRRREERPLPQGLTKNGERIFNTMRDNKVKGNWKDWVLFVGDQMIDRYGTYTITRGEDAPPDVIALVHKSKLAKILGEKFGGMFWDAQWKRRTNHGAPPAKTKTVKES